MSSVAQKQRASVCLSLSSSSELLYEKRVVAPRSNTMLPMPISFTCLKAGRALMSDARVTKDSTTIRRCKLFVAWKRRRITCTNPNWFEASVTCIPDKFVNWLKSHLRLSSLIVVFPIRRQSALEWKRPWIKMTRWSRPIVLTAGHTWWVSQWLVYLLN